MYSPLPPFSSFCGPLAPVISYIKWITPNPTPDPTPITPSILYSNTKRITNPTSLTNTDEQESTGSTNSTSSADAAAATHTQNQSPPTVSERRRSSASGNGAGLFSNLQNQKREGGGSDMAGRRASWNEQSAKGGVFSKLWQGYTRGA